MLIFLKTNEESVEKYNEINGRLNEMVEGKLKYDEENLPRIDLHYLVTNLEFKLK